MQFQEGIYMFLATYQGATFVWNYYLRMIVVTPDRWDVLVCALEQMIGASFPKEYLACVYFTKTLRTVLGLCSR